MRLHRIFSLLFLFALTACSGPEILNAAITKNGYHVAHDIAYGHDARQRMDIYTPDGLTRPAPVIVFFYGGSWQHGSKEDYLFVGQAFASRGFVTVIADYRLYPQVRFPDFLKDGARAFRFAHAHIASYGGDPNHMFLAGHSAGAHIAMMLTLDDHYLREAHASKEWVKGTIGISGPYDFLPLTDPALIELFRQPNMARTQPIHFVRRGEPPMLLVHGEEDDTVLPANTEHLAAALQRLGNQVETHYYPDIGHIDMIVSLAEHFRHTAPLLDDINHFIQTHE